MSIRYTGGVAGRTADPLTPSVCTYGLATIAGPDWCVLGGTGDRVTGVGGCHSPHCPPA